MVSEAKRSRTTFCFAVRLVNALRVPLRPLWFAFAFVLLATPLVAQKAKSTKKTVAPDTWKAPTYHRITIGKSHKPEVVKALGKPSSTRKPSLSAFAGESCCEELVYKGKGDNGGDLSIAMGKNGPVIYIIDAFARAMPRSTAYRKFGSDWHPRTYSIAHCAESGGVSPIYRDKGGPIELAEYPSKGLILWPSEDSYDYFGAVYVARAPGMPKPPACVANEKKTTPATMPTTKKK